MAVFPDGLAKNQRTDFAEDALAQFRIERMGKVQQFKGPLFEKIGIELIVAQKGDLIFQIEPVGFEPRMFSGQPQFRCVKAVAGEHTARAMDRMPGEIAGNDRTDKRDKVASASAADDGFLPWHGNSRQTLMFVKLGGSP